MKCKMEMNSAEMTRILEFHMVIHDGERVIELPWKNPPPPALRLITIKTTMKILGQVAKLT